MRSNPFDSPNLLLNRAQENRGELNERAKTFFDAHPYAYRVDRDQEAGQYVCKIGLTSDLPPDLWSIAADALNNLRSALDQCVCATVTMLNPAASLDGIYFPFGDSKTHFEKSIAKIAPKIHPRVADVVDFFKPYKGGNSRLWALKNLTNSNKHRSLIGFSASVDNVEVNTLDIPGARSFRRPYWDARKNELIISRTVDKIEPRYDLNVSFHIAFGDIEGLHGKPVIESIDYLSAIVSSFLTGMESDIKRILCGESF